MQRHHDGHGVFGHLRWQSSPSVAGCRGRCRGPPPPVGQQSPAPDSRAAADRIHRGRDKGHGEGDLASKARREIHVLDPKVDVPGQQDDVVVCVTDACQGLAAEHFRGAVAVRSEEVIVFRNLGLVRLESQKEERRRQRRRLIRAKGARRDRGVCVCGQEAARRLGGMWRGGGVPTDVAMIAWERGDHVGCCRAYGSRCTASSRVGEPLAKQRIRRPHLRANRPPGSVARAVRAVQANGQPTADQGSPRKRRSIGAPLPRAAEQPAGPWQWRLPRRPPRVGPARAPCQAGGRGQGWW